MADNTETEADCQSSWLPGDSKPVLQQPLLRRPPSRRGRAAPLSEIVQDCLFDSAVHSGRQRELVSSDSPKHKSWGAVSSAAADPCDEDAVSPGAHHHTRGTSGSADNLFTVSAGARGKGKNLNPRRASPSRRGRSAASRMMDCNMLRGNAAARNDHRYRRIEDLAFFMNTGTVNEDTFYFLDPMQRRAGTERLAQRPEQFVAKNPRSLSEQSEGYVERVDKVAAIVPRSVLSAKRQFDSTTGLVKPYAMGRGDTVKVSQTLDFNTMENAMDAYVLRMQCQRPTKGLFLYNK